MALGLVLLWKGDLAPEAKWTLSLGVTGCWIGFASALRQRAIRPLQTMANLLLALREGDFSFRARGAKHDDPLGEALSEINLLGSVLQSQRRGAIEATALLRTVMEEINVAIFAFDAERHLRLVNRAGERLLAEPEERLLGRKASDLGLDDCLEGKADRLLSSTDFPGAKGRWDLRRTSFRQDGRPHHLVVVADLTQPLRKEELEAWQRLVRVLGHELNNSLAPIKSIAGSLGGLLRRNDRPPDWEEDLRSGLDVIASRAEALGRFLQAYAQLAKLPPPVLGKCDVGQLARQVIALEPRLSVRLLEGPTLQVACDAGQIEQTLINLIKNAVDAALENHASNLAAAEVDVAWAQIGTSLEIRVEDNGPGLAQTTNLFVPFYTTKADGSGIGLVLCRQIAENHGGSLALSNRTDGPGCVATLVLPLAER